MAVAGPRQRVDELPQRRASAALVRPRPVPPGQASRWWRTHPRNGDPGRADADQSVAEEVPPAYPVARRVSVPARGEPSESLSSTTSPFARTFKIVTSESPAVTRRWSPARRPRTVALATATGTARRARAKAHERRRARARGTSERDIFSPAIGGTLNALKHSSFQLAPLRRPKSCLSDAVPHSDSRPRPPV